MLTSSILMLRKFTRFGRSKNDNDNDIKVHKMIFIIKTDRVIIVQILAVLHQDLLHPRN